MSTLTEPLPLPSTFKVGVSRTRLEVKQFFREREQLIFTFFFPIIFLGIFSAVFGDTDFNGVNAATYFTPGMSTPSSNPAIASSSANCAIEVTRTWPILPMK